MTGRVLIVDDDAPCRTALAHALEPAGHPIVEAGTGEEALAVSQHERPALTVTEVLLPATSGYEVCRAVKARHGADVPVILVSALRSHPADRVAGLLIGADDYLVKPVHPDELLARARRLLAQHRPRSDAELDSLTPREQEVLALLADGLDQTRIAERLVITPRTVAKHVEHILAKLGVRTRTQAVARALRPGGI